MSTFTETWSNLSRWSIPSGKAVVLSGGRCYAAPGADNARAELVEAAPDGRPFLFVEVEAFIVDGFSIRCFDAEGVYTDHETRFTHEYGSIYLDRFINSSGLAVDVVAHRARLFSLPSGQYLFRVGFAVGWLFFKVYQSGVLVRYLVLHIGQCGEVHALAVSPGQAVDPEAGPHPWVGQVVSLDCLNRYDFPALLGPEEIAYSDLVVPDLPDQIPFREGAYSIWTSSSFGGSGNLTFSARGLLPPGIVLTPDGSSLVLSGVPAAGAAGDWTFDVVVDDGLQPKTVSVSMRIVVASAFDVPGDAVTIEAMALGDFYYQLTGGPLRLEMTKEA